MIRWTASSDEAKIIVAIAQRAARELGIKADDVEIDITACHLHGCPLSLQKLLDADRLNFCHDIMEIARHLDRSTGKLGSNFVPRYAK